MPSSQLHRATVLHHRPAGRGFYRLVLLAPALASVSVPGHFVMLRLHEGSERIPLTVADFDRKKGTITMVTQALGKTTREMAQNYKQGDRVLIGPSIDLESADQADLNYLNID